MKDSKDSAFTSAYNKLRIVAPFIPITIKSFFSYWTIGPVIKSWPLSFHIVFNILKSALKPGFLSKDLQRPENLQSQLIISPQLDPSIIITPLQIPRSKTAVDFMKTNSSHFPQSAEYTDFDYDKTKDLKDSGFAGPGVECEWMFSKDSENSKKILIYVHGGAYILGAMQVYRRLNALYIKKQNCRVLGVNYRLAPQNPYPCAIIDVFSVYLYLLKQGFKPSNIVFSGDSAGGGLCLATLLALRDSKAASIPGGAILLSPWVDLTGSLPSFRFFGKTDYLPYGSVDDRLQGRRVHYAANDELRNQYVSPLFAGSLRGLPPLLIQCGSVERLRDEVVLFAARAATSPFSKNFEGEKATPVHLEIYEDQVHVFQMFSFLKSSRTAMRRSLRFFEMATSENEKETIRSKNFLFDPQGELFKNVEFDESDGFYHIEGKIGSSSKL